MILLDTNVLSALMRREPEIRIVRWLDQQPRTSVWTTSITVFEVRFGLQSMAAGKRQRALAEAFETLLTDLLEERVAAFDGAAAAHAAALLAARQKKGLPGELRDTMIAGIALATHASLATRNVRHFEDLGLPVVNPWES